MPYEFHDLAGVQQAWATRKNNIDDRLVLIRGEGRLSTLYKDGDDFVVDFNGHPLVRYHPDQSVTAVFDGLRTRIVRDRITRFSPFKMHAHDRVSVLGIDETTLVPEFFHDRYHKGYGYRKGMTLAFEPHAVVRRFFSLTDLWVLEDEMRAVERYAGVYVMRLRAQELTIGHTCLECRLEVNGRSLGDLVKSTHLLSHISHSWYPFEIMARMIYAMPPSQLRQRYAGILDLALGPRLPYGPQYYRVEMSRTEQDGLKEALAVYIRQQIEKL
jgi:hypothetical protein